MRVKLLAAIMAAVVVLAGCSSFGKNGNVVTLPEDKAKAAKAEIEEIAAEYAPLADEAFADESVEVQVKRAELRSRLYTLLKLLLPDVKIEEGSSHDWTSILIRVVGKLAGVTL